MKFDAIRRLIEQAESKAIQAGVPFDVVRSELVRVETAFISALIQQNRALLDEIRSKGTERVARRLGKSASQVRRYRARILSSRIKPIDGAR